jgi:hypothetical protein
MSLMSVNGPQAPMLLTSNPSGGGLDQLSETLDTPRFPHYAHYMSNFTAPADQTIYSAHGEFETFGLPQTDEEWAAYDRYLADEMADFDAGYEDDYVDLDPEPPF